MDRATENELGSEIKNLIEETKNKFCKIIDFLNYAENFEIYNKLSSSEKNHLDLLQKLWKKNDDVNVEHYFNMKVHHAYIIGFMIEYDNLKDLWSDYIKSGMDLRVKLLELVDLTTNLRYS